MGEQPGININRGLPHARAHMCTFTHMHNTHVRVHTFNQTDPLFLPAKAAADLLFKTNELGSWAIEFNGTQLSQNAQGHGFNPYRHKTSKHSEVKKEVQTDVSTVRTCANSLSLLVRSST